MKLEEQKLGKLQVAILLRTILPMLVLAVLIAGVAVQRSQSALEQEIVRSLLVTATAAAAAYDAAYPGEYRLEGEIAHSVYKGEQDLTQTDGLLDQIKAKTGMELSLFYADTRVATTLTNAAGERYFATGANASVMHQIEERDAAIYYNDAEIDGTVYYVCYLPLHNADGSRIGMVGAALPTTAMRSQLRESIRPVWVITLLGLLLASYISLRFTSRLTAAIGQIRAFLLKMVGGTLDNELAESVTKRQDELGDTGNALLRMQNAVRILVERDPLTTLYNRRYGNAKLKNLMLRSEKTGEPFAIAIGDIDFFKKVNDTYGHDAGDAILKYVSEELKTLMGGRGAAVRWGGEEFLLMFENHTLGMAVGAVEEFLERIRTAEIRYDEQIIRITMTMGLVPGVSETELGELIRQADEKLYYGKENGRDQLVVDRSLLKGTVTQTAEDGGAVVLGFSEDFLDSENLMQLLTETAAKQAEQQDEA